MSRKIIGVTVGTQLPKPNFKQTDPTKGDYIKNKPDFEGLKARVDNKADLVDGKVPLEQLPDNIGGEQVQADFNQNDSTQLDYIKNRPFYAYNDSVMLLDNASCTSFDVTDGEGLLYGAMFNEVPYIEGETATIVLDGVSYELTRKYSEDMDAPYFGNGAIINVMGASLEDTGEPFICAIAVDGGSTMLVFYFTDTQETDHTVSVGINAETIKTLDIKYLPKNMALGYEERAFDDIIWDGNTDGLISAGFDMDDGDGGVVTYMWCKVSDAVLSKESYINSTISLYYPDENYEDSVLVDSNDWFFDLGENGSFVLADMPVINIVQNNESIDFTDIMGIEETLVFSEKGTYLMKFLYNGNEVVRTSKLVAASTLVQIDKKFLPISDDQVQSDYNQSDSTKPDYIKNRPFYEDTILIELPSDISNSIIVNSQPIEALGGIAFSFVKTSDNYFASPEETYGASINITANGDTLDFTIDESYVNNLGNGFALISFDGGFYPLAINVDTVGVSILPTADILGEYMVFNFTETGLYFLYVEGMAAVNSYKKNELKQIDKKYIPDTSWDDIKNKPFYDTRKISYYSQSKTPNPVSFTLAATDNIFYKVSDLVPTREEIFGDIKILIGNKYGDITEIVPVEKDIRMEVDEFIMCASASYALLFANTAGVVSFTYSGYNLSLEVPEAGIYYVLSGMSSTMAEGRTVEVQLGGEFKTLDLKFIPDMYYDTRVKSYYSQAENPNPVSFDNQMMNYSFYKISDLVPTREQIFGEMTIVNQVGKNIAPSESNILIEVDGAIVTHDGAWGFLFTSITGDVSFTYSGYSMSIPIPETGIYYIRPLNDGVPEGRTFEVTFGELKQIDEKFIPIAYPNGTNTINVLPSQSVGFFYNEDMGIYMSAIELSEADIEKWSNASEITVMWDETKYIQPLVYYNGMKAWGNMTFVGLGFTGEPFVLGLDEYEGQLMVLSMVDPAPDDIDNAPMVYHTLGISYKKDSVFTDSKYFNIENMLTVRSGDVIVNKAKYILEEADPDMGMYAAEAEGILYLPKAKRVCVNWNGVEYVCEVQYVDEVYAVGNIGLMTDGNLTGEPFIIVTDNAELYFIYALDGSAVCEFGITAVDEFTGKIDGKYLNGGDRQAIGYVDPDSQDPITSSAVYNALGGRAQVNTAYEINSYDTTSFVTPYVIHNALGYRNRLEFDYTPQSGSNNLITSGAVYDAIANKKITVDSSVQSGSNNAVSSHAVYTALQDIHSLIGDCETVIDSIGALVGGEGV